MRKQYIWILTVGIGAAMIAVLTALLLQQPEKPVVISLQEEETVQVSGAGAMLSATQCALGEHTAAPQIRHSSEVLPPFSTTPDTNLNTAGTADLQAVSGVGAVLAEEIVSYRESIGGFTRRSQLMEIHGIGETLAARIMDTFYIPNELPEEETTVPEKGTSVPQQETETAPAEPQEQENTEQEFLMLNLNTAQKEDLMRLPGMTELLADKIIKLREDIGGYQNIQELLLIEGMKPEYFEYTLREHVYVTE